MVLITESNIYIPLWLDLLFLKKVTKDILYLIYIPLWLDLLYKYITQIQFPVLFTFHYG